MKSHAAIAGIALFAAACGSPSEKSPRERAPQAVRIETVGISEHTGTFEAGGSIRAQSTAVLSSRILAPVVAVRVDIGNRVRAGQPLVVLEDRALVAERTRAEAALAAAQQAVLAAGAEQQGATAALSLATLTHRRMAMLRTRNSATPGELDEAVAGLRGAEARVNGSNARAAVAARGRDAAKAALQAASTAASYAVIAAPFDGVVTAREVDPGSLAAPGVPLLTVEDTRRYQLHLQIDTSRASTVAVGTPVAVSTEGSPPLKLDGIVAEIGSAFDPVTHTALVKIDLSPAGGLRSGLFARARLPEPTRDAITVPATAVLRRGQVAMVFVDEQGTARMRMIRVGEHAGERVEILAGLGEGERVVLDPPGHLTDGTPLEFTTAANPEGAR